MNGRLFGGLRLPVILQGEAAECGLACIAMVSAYFGRNISLSVLRRSYPVTSTGATLAKVIEIAERQNLAGRPVKLELSDLRKLQLPAILHWNLNHYVVLQKVKRKTCVVHDPASGRRIYTLSEISRYMTGVALELTPTKLFQKTEIKEINKLTDFFHITKEFYFSVFQISLLSIMLQLAALFMPFYLLLTLDLGLSKRDNDWLLVIAIAFLLVGLSKAIVDYMRGVAVMHFTNEIGLQMVSNVYHHLLRLPLEFFEKRRLHDLVSRLESIDHIRDVLTKDIISLVVDGIFSLSALVVLAFLSPLLAALTFGVLVIYVGFRILINPIERSQYGALLEEKNNHQGIVLSHLRTMQLIKLRCSEQKQYTAWQSAYISLLNTGIHIQKLTLSSEFFRAMVFAIENIATVYFGSRLVNNLELTPGQFIAFVVLKQQFTWSFSTMFPKLIELMSLRLRLERIADITFHQTEFDHFALHPFRPRISGEILFDSVSYSYSGSSRLVLDTLSFKISSRQIIGIKGRSGSGKSTLLRLMMGLASPASGKIFVDNVLLEDFGLREYRYHTSAITHGASIVPGSLIYNIAMDDDVDPAKVETVARLVQIHDHIMTLPMNYQSQMGDLGVSLSAGQAQRVLLARAIYKMPKLLFLDEALSHLEDDMAQAILSAIKGLGITIVMVTHSPGLFRLCDRIFVLDGQKISEENSLILDGEIKRQEEKQVHAEVMT